MKQFAMAVAVISVLAAIASEAQTVCLRQAGTGNSQVEASVGDVIEIEIIVDVQEVPSAGIAAFVSVEGSGLAVVDKGLPGQVGTQPFSPGPLFEGAVVPTNVLVPENDPVAAVIPGQQLDYTTVLGIGSDGMRTGQGVVATFSLLCVSPTEGGRVVVDDNPIRETRLIGADRVSEMRFATVWGMEITILDAGTGIDARTWGELKQEEF